MADVPMVPNRTAVYVVSGLIGAAGLGLILMSLQKGIPYSTIPLAHGTVSGLKAQGLTTSQQNLDPNVGGQIQVAIGSPISAAMPTVVYAGPGQDVFTYFSIMQHLDGEWVTVYGSGVAGVHVGPPNPGATSASALYPLVSPQEVQPPYPPCISQSLCAFPFPGQQVSPICGRQAVRGVASALLWIFQKAADSGNPSDADGFSSPTCNPRKPALVKEYHDAILFV